MHARVWPATALALLATFGAASAALASGASAAQDDALRALDGEWLYVEDRTEGRPSEQQGPSMSARFALRVETGAVVLVHGHGSGHRDVRVALDGAVTEIPDGDSVAIYRGAWKDGEFEYETEYVRVSDGERDMLIRREFRPTSEGLLVCVTVDPPAGTGSLSLYRHPQDIPLPTPAKATANDLAWLAGVWVGARGSSSIEERWSPPLGGALLGTSRTVKGGKMSAFEYLRVVERDGGLIYVAQPGGAAPTEFVLTELSPTRAVFQNPRHDYPQRIAYELSVTGGLSATIGLTKGGSPRRFEFEREGE